MNIVGLSGRNPETESWMKTLLAPLATVRQMEGADHIYPDTEALTTLILEWWRPGDADRG